VSSATEFRFRDGAHIMPEDALRLTDGSRGIGEVT